MIKKLELRLLVITILFETEFGHLLFVKSYITVLFLILNRYFIYQDDLFISSLMAENIAVFVRVCTSKAKSKKLNGIERVRIL